jgi:hypothetical protein
MGMGREEEQECRHEKAQSLARRFQTSIHKKSSQVEDESVKNEFRPATRMARAGSTLLV